MSETVMTPPDSPDKPQDQLFGVAPGAYEDHQHIVYPSETEISKQSFVTPEKPSALENTTAEDMIKIALEDRLTPDIHGHFDDKRAAFIKKYHWTPFSKQEATVAIADGRYNPGLVNYLLRTRDEGGLAAASKVISMVDRAKAGVTIAIETLREAQNIETGDFLPNAVRSNVHVRQVLAREIFARNSLNLFEWPHHYLKKTKQVKTNPKVDAKLQAITDALSTMDDETLVDLCNKTSVHERERGRFWVAQDEIVRTHKDTQDLVAAARSHA